MNFKLITLAAILLVPFQSCTTTKNMQDNQRSSGHFRLYSYPDKTAPDLYDKERFKKLVIVSSNDFNGHIQAKKYPIRNKFEEKRVLKVGGLSAMRAYTDIFKSVYKDNLLYLDSGSFLSPENDHDYTIFLYNYLAVDVASLGFNELKLKTNSKNYMSYLESLTRKSQFKIVTSNLFDLTQAKSLELSGVKDTHIQTINGIKVGIFGVLGQETANEIPKDKLNGIYIQNTPKNIISKSNYLRRQGAKVIILLTNSSIDCSSQIAQDEELPIQKVNFNPRQSEQCDTYNNLLHKTLQMIPPKTVDLIITSGGKMKVANFVEGYPIMQNEGKGEYLSWAELYFDTKLDIVDQKQTKLHQPVQLCHNFLKENQDCYNLENINGKELAPAVFLGQEVQIKELPTPNGKSTLR